MGARKKEHEANASARRSFLRSRVGTRVFHALRVFDAWSVGQGQTTQSVRKNAPTRSMGARSCALALSLLTAGVDVRRLAALDRWPQLAGQPIGLDRQMPRGVVVEALWLAVGSCEDEQVFSLVVLEFVRRGRLGDLDPAGRFRRDRRTGPVDKGVRGSYVNVVITS